MAVQDSQLLRVIDLTGTFVLAIQGASIGAEKGLDFLGVMVISLVTAMGGAVRRRHLFCVADHCDLAALAFADAASALTKWLLVGLGLRRLQRR